MASYSAAPGAGTKLTLKSGSTVVLDVYTGNGPVVLPFNPPLQMPDDTGDVNVVLDASGTGGKLGGVTVVGFLE